MKENINNKVLSNSNNILNTILVFILGISLGIFSKWIDSISLSDLILWHRIIEFIDLRNILSELPIWVLIAACISIFSKSPKRASLNVFLFFIGMNISYHLYSIYVCGFNPKSYMMIWYMITFISPLLASLCWYAKQDSKIATILRILILACMMIVTFYVGYFYISFGRIVNILFLAIMILILWKNPKETLLNILCAVVLRTIIGLIFYI